ncbi:hypothetical protein ACI65C_006579 [Semiaphis heraclei]
MVLFDGRVKSKNSRFPGIWTVPCAGPVPLPLLLPGNRIHHALQAQKDAFSRLNLIKKEREKMDIDMDKLNVELAEFKTYVHDKSFKVEDYIDKIDECENIIKDEKLKQEDYQKNIKSIGIKIKELDKIVQDATSRIESYKPYEACYIDI